jgi:phosphoglycerate dehydrogenase-like enzyme
MYLLILNPSAADYEKALKPKFPQLSIHAAAREEEIRDLIEKIDILFTIRISDHLIKKASNLKWIQVMITGVDYIINLPSLRKEVLITSARGIHGPQMSEMAFLLMLALNRNFPQVIRNQDQKTWDRWPGKVLYQKKVAILGVGVIGEEIARKCKAFGMTVFGIGSTKRKVEGIDHFYGMEDLVEVIRDVDYFVCVAPLTPQTRKIIGPKMLASMKPSAFLINLGRGEVLDEEALVEALKTGKIAGAALDVFSKEPLPKDHPLWEMKNLIITPHVGGLSDIYVDQVLPLLEENLRRFLQGERKNLINLVER